MSHPAHIYYTLDQYLTEHVGKVEDRDKSEQLFIKRTRYWTIRWNRHVEKHGNVPLITKCAVCSGKERKTDIKLGRWKISTRKSRVDGHEDQNKEE